jgi:type IV secretion system protein TrbL
MNMEPGILTTTLQSFIKDFSNGWFLLQPAINFLIKVFLGIEIVMIGLWMALGGIDNLVGVMKKFLYLLVWAWIIKEYPTLADAFVQSLVQAGVIAGGGAIGNTNIFDPSSIISLGFNNMGTVFDELGGPGALLFSSSALVICVCLILSLIAYIIIAWQIFYSILEFYLISALTGLFLPFGFFEPTKFLAEKAIGAVVSSGIKLMVLAFIVTVSTPVLHNLSLPHALAFKEAATSLLIVGALAFLCWNAPGVAAGLMSGSPSLSAGIAMQNTVVAGGMAAMAIMGAVKAGEATFGAVKAATSSVSEKLGKTGGSSGSGSGDNTSGGAGNGSGNGSGGNVGGAAGKQVPEALNPSTKTVDQTVQKTAEIVSAKDQGMKSAGGQVANVQTPNATQESGPSTVAAETAAKTAQSAGTTPQSGSDIQPKKDNSSDWAKAALKAMQHTPQEAHPSGGGSQPKL